MLQDRNPLLALVSDKLKVRDYVASKIGSKHLIRLLWTGKNPDEIPYNILPSKFVIKTNHGAGYYIIVKDNKETLNKEDTTRQLKIWLRENYCHDKYLGIEWGYRNIKPTILIESFLSDNGKLPVDYKFFCFSGRVEFLFLHFDRLEEHKNMILDRNFESPPFEIDFPQWNGEFTRPKNFELMLKIAELLSQDFAFIRVDLYSVGEKVFFGELTPYPGGIGVKILRKREDYIFGNRWKFISNRNASF